MKYKLLCDRCYADEKAFTVHKNAYNNGKCYTCNGHGYILTKDEAKAKESHVKYLPTIELALKIIKIETKKEVESLNELKTYEADHKEKYKEIYSNLLNLMKDAEDSKSDNNIELSEEYKWISKYKKKRNILKNKLNEANKSKENSVKRLEQVQAFYFALLQPVNNNYS